MGQGCGLGFTWIPYPRFEGSEWFRRTSYTKVVYFIGLLVCVCVCAACQVVDVHPTHGCSQGLVQVVLWNPQSAQWYIYKTHSYHTPLIGCRTPLMVGLATPCHWESLGPFWQVTINFSPVWCRAQVSQGKRRNSLFIHCFIITLCSYRFKLYV